MAPATTPTGCRKACSTGSRRAARADTPAWMKGFLDTFYNIDTLRGTLVSDQAWQASWNLAVTASATAAVACIATWTTDFRADLPKIDVPILVIHGDADQVLPLDKTGQRLPALINDIQLVVEGGPHAIPWTHADQVNAALLNFLRSCFPAATAVSPGIIQTPAHPADSYDRLGGRLPPLGRVGQVSDVVDAILFLESSPYITGEILHIDGGQSAGH
jgi:Enoyl-(Acyl carrier protein) reductase